MDFDSPDVEKDFPGLCGRKNKDDSDFSDGDHEKLSKKELLLGRRKDKKDKKDRGYATLAGDSSPEDETEIKSPSKSAKKSKAFKFPSKSKEKREKSREKEKLEKEVKDKDRDSIENKDKKKDKDKKEKEKKEKFKDKEKDKKDKKIKQASVSEEVLDLGDVQPIFGVSLGLAVERSRCHDNVNIPLVVRDCIDYLQEFGVMTEQIYKIDPVKSRLLQLKKLYNNRESTGTNEFDIATACGLLKLYLKELPEPILTTDLITRFEEAAALPQVTQQEFELQSLIDQLPGCNKTLVSWLSLHLDAVTEHEKIHKMNAQSLAMLLSPTIQMSHRLFVAILCHCHNLFPDVKLHKYIPPITATSPNLPENPDEISKELRKQESFLSQIHAEMNAGFVSKKREEQLWEVQRIITQLKRKLRSFEKKESCQKSIDDVVDGEVSIDLSLQKLTKLSCSDDESVKTITALSAESVTNPDITPQETPEETIAQEDKIKELDNGKESRLLSNLTNSDTITIGDNGLLILPENHPEYLSLIRLQLENYELMQWKSQLQSRINAERSELVRLKRQLLSIASKDTSLTNTINYIDQNITDEADYERVINHFIKQNNLLEQTRNMLVRQIFEENKELVQLQVELTMQKFKM